MLVDDEVYLTHDYYQALLDASYNVTSAESADEALEYVKTEHFDLVIVDITMHSGRSLSAIDTAGGFKTALALARKIKDLVPHTRLVALTSSTDPEVVAWFTVDRSVAAIYPTSVSISTAYM